MTGLLIAEAPWESWMDDPTRACAGADTDEFFRLGYGGRQAVEEYCARCPVMVQCGEWALAVNDSLVGVWGGLTQEDRRRIRAKRAMRDIRAASRG